jgi:hypothetical protein
MAKKKVSLNDRIARIGSIRRALDAAAGNGLIERWLEFADPAEHDGKRFGVWLHCHPEYVECRLTEAYLLCLGIASANASRTGR